MHPKIQAFLELEYQKEDLKAKLKALNEATEALIAEFGVGYYFQDPQDSVVYKLIENQGCWVEFRKFGYHRTKRAHEKRGDLSMKEAKEAGFKLKDE